ncbi:hypothetical protein RND81_14G211300 [Saponaria officinalis]|uniref:Uncharacterized protein n=1 Tax=Saponaria officinalis TaxID=3572 RepID=A0AAW1GUQ6_SAPOF
MNGEQKRPYEEVCFLLKCHNESNYNKGRYAKGICQLLGGVWCGGRKMLEPIPVKRNRNCSSRQWSRSTQLPSCNNCFSLLLLHKHTNGFTSLASTSMKRKKDNRVDVIVDKAKTCLCQSQKVKNYIWARSLIQLLCVPVFVQFVFSFVVKRLEGG